VEGTTYLDVSAWETLLVNPVLERQKRVTCWLINEELKYEYTRRGVRIEQVVIHSDHHATVVAQVSGNRILREQNGTLIRDYGYETYKAIYELERLRDDKWYIYCFQALDDHDRGRCEVNLGTDNPCQSN
jgi:ARC6-like protein